MGGSSLAALPIGFATSMALLTSAADGWWEPSSLTIGLPFISTSCIYLLSNTWMVSLLCCKKRAASRHRDTLSLAERAIETQDHERVALQDSGSLFQVLTHQYHHYVPDIRMNRFKDVLPMCIVLPMLCSAVTLLCKSCGAFHASYLQCALPIIVLFILAGGMDLYCRTSLVLLRLC